MAESLYRKYRPQIFEDVVGQEHIERTLKNAIAQDKVSHAYLFCGPRGTGKTTTARLLAKALLCEKGPTPDPDGTCEDCRLIADGAHPDVNELDAASRTGVENVREEIIGRVQFAPTRGRYKIYIIDEVHMLSSAAFNALLKTLEEPPSHVVFILCTTDPQQVPETIHSRCQRFDFRRISNEALVSRLGAVCVAEGVEFEGEALDLIAHRSDGGMRNALTSLEQVIAFSDGAVTLENAERLLGAMDASELGEIMTAIGRRDVAACFRWTADFVETGADLAEFTRELASHVRNLYVMTLAGADVALEVSSSERREMESELPLFAPDRLARLLSILGELGQELKTSTNPRLSFEIALTRMVRPDSDLTLESLAERIEALESGYSAVAHVSSMPAQAQVQPAAAQPQPQPAVQQAAQAIAQPQPEHATVAQEVPRAESREPRYEPAQSAFGSSKAAAAQTAPSQAQPTAASSAQPQGTAAGGAVSAQLAQSLSNPASLQRVWQAALTALKKEKAAYGVLFLNTKAVFDAAAGALVVEFPAENTFAFKAAQKPDVQVAVEEALARSCGERLSFSYVQGGKRVAAGVSAEPAAHVQQQPATNRIQPAMQTEARAETRFATQPAAQSAPQSDQQPAVQQSVAQQPVHQEAQAFSSRDAVPTAQPEAHAAALVASESAYDDVVPYDDMVPYDDETALSYDVPPWDEPAPYGESRPTHPQVQQSQAQQQSRPQQASQPQQPQPQPQPAADSLPPEPGDSARNGRSQAAGPDDLQAILAAGFGDGVSFEEVRE